MSEAIAMRLCKAFPDTGMCIVQADNGKFLAKNNGVTNEGDHIHCDIFARLVE